MKRDMDLCRSILAAIEDDDSAPDRTVKINIPGHSESEINYHIMLLHESGLIDALAIRNFEEFEFRPKSLTWAGHDFLDAARNETVWNAAKAKVLKTAGFLSLELLKTALIEYGNDALRG